MDQLTAAHRTLPFGTVLAVRNVANNKTVQVRVNDRGPFAGKRLIDLSHAAAQTITMPGTANVELQVISSPKTRAAPVYTVQVGAFTNEAEARALRVRLQQQYGAATILFRPEDEIWRVLVGSFQTTEEAEILANTLNTQTGSAYVVLQDEQD